MSVGKVSGVIKIGDLSIQFEGSSANQLSEVPAKVAAAVENKLMLLSGEKALAGQLKAALAQIEGLKTQVVQAASEPVSDGGQLAALREENEALRHDIAELVAKLAKAEDKMLEASIMAEQAAMHGGHEPPKKKRGRPKKSEE